MSAPLSILLVEDYVLDALLLQELFAALPESERPRLVQVDSVAAAEAELGARDYDCVLLDLGLPDGEGVENIQRVRACAPHTPIVVMTGQDDDQRAIEALRLGAQEYLVKGRHDPSALLRRLRHAIQRNDVLAQIDRERTQQQRLAGLDPLTGLPNRQQLAVQALDALAQAERRGQRLALSFVDLDGFKALNDRHGHAIGDAALVAVARALQHAVRAEDVVARLGGDEFVVLQAPVQDEQAVFESGARLMTAVHAITQVNDEPVQLGASVGTAIYPDHGRSLDALLAHADTQMYGVKRRGGGHAVERTPVPQAGALSDEAALVFQPWSGLDGHAAGVEALLRHRHEGRWTGPDQLLAPNRHADLWQWVLHGACQAWMALRLPAGARLAVNMSARDLLAPGFAPALSRTLAQSGLAPQALQIEIAEPLLGAPDAALCQVLLRLRERGVRVVLDRFGAGQGSLRLLATLPLDGVKIDCSVVRGLAGPAPDVSRAMLAGAVATAAARALEVVAVGVESAEAARACRDMGCARLQGRWFASPVDAQALPALLERASL